MPHLDVRTLNDLTEQMPEEGRARTLRERFHERSRPLIMHPAIFVSVFMLLGLLFALQQWVEYRMWGTKLPVNFLLVIAAWVLQYFVWGSLCWSVWFWMGSRLVTARWKYLLVRLLPLSILMSVFVEMVLVVSFPQLPVSKRNLSFIQRLDYDVATEFMGNMSIFWAAFLAFRMLGYYQQVRQKERALSQLSVELAQTQMQALRMQINPHFLFNTMNSISSLMHLDVKAADSMLEQLSSMLRISLERGSTQMIPLRKELEFIEMYLALQDMRYAGRIQQKITVEPHLWDAMVPTMFLQPLVENAFVHGFSQSAREGRLEIRATHRENRISIVVRNSGTGLHSAAEQERGKTGTGLSNIRNRLQLLFHEEQSLTIGETAPDMVQVNVWFPLVFLEEPEKDLVEYDSV